MEIFVPDRTPHETMALMERLRGLGIRGRDAAYLASVKPPEQPGSPEMRAYLRDFELMVDEKARASAAEAIGIELVSNRPE